jgi:hypothetical protein
MREGNLQKHTLNLFSGDYERLQLLYPDVGAGPIIRRILRWYIGRVEATGQAPGLDLDGVNINV